MIEKHADFLLYTIKCLVGVAIGFFIYRAFPVVGAWCLVSIVLVLSPNHDDEMKLAINRIYANLVGAGIGLALFAIHPVNLLMLSVGVIVVVAICQLLKLRDASRSAAVALVIVLLHEKGKHFWDVALGRAAGVVGGCLIAMLIIFVTQMVTTKLKIYATDQPAVSKGVNRIN